MKDIALCPFLHSQRVEQARPYLEAWMDEAKLPELSRERLRDAFRGTDKGGIKQAVRVEMRLINGGAR